MNSSIRFLSSVCRGEYEPRTSRSGVGIVTSELMGLLPGFKQQCKSEFPHAWTTSLYVPGDANTVHILDGMCYLHRFAPDFSQDAPLLPMEQLIDFFQHAIEGLPKGDARTTVVLCFDITRSLPLPKQATLGKRDAHTAHEQVIWPNGDSSQALMRGHLPYPWGAALHDREARMAVCAELSHRLLNISWDRIEFGIYGLHTIDSKPACGLLFCDNTFVCMFEVGEGDLSMAYVASKLSADDDTCLTCIHTVDTDLIPIFLLQSTPRTYVSLTAYSPKTGILRDVVDIDGLKRNLKESFGEKCIRGIVTAWILQGTDFVERLVIRGSWQSLFARMHEINKIHPHFFETLAIWNSETTSMDMNGINIRKFLQKFVPKTISASTKNQNKRRRIDATLDTFTICRLKWQLVYWEMSIFHPQEFMKGFTEAGWEVIDGKVLRKGQSPLQ